MRRISVFGATGSIGASFFSLIDALYDAPREECQFAVIAGHQNIDQLCKLALKYRPEMVICDDEAGREALRDALPASIETACGKSALTRAAKIKVDWCLNAIIGAAGLGVSLAAAGGAKTLALANKESMVCGGALLRAECARYDTALFPVDSEHSGLAQALLGQDRASLKSVTLTASGGPFLHASLDEMRVATPEDALKHPSWDMGDRISIDSASMFNKALELIEAKELFELSPSQINVLVHPQSIIHALVEFNDGNLLAQASHPDMRMALSFALGYPERLEFAAPKLDLAQIGALEFLPPDEDRFPALRLGRMAMEEGGVMPAALNAAKEVALDRFLAREIGFLDMASIVEEVMMSGDWGLAPESLAIIEEADAQARELARRARQ